MLDLQILDYFKNNTMYNWITSWWSTKIIAIPNLNTPNVNQNIKPISDQDITSISTNVSLDTEENVKQPLSSSLISTNILTGPARNAPNEGQHIKQLFDHKPSSVTLLTTNDILRARSALKKTNINSNPIAIEIPPLIGSLHAVFQQGNNDYFESVRRRRSSIKYITCSNDVVTNSDETNIEFNDNTK